MKNLHRIILTYRLNPDVGLDVKSLEDLKAYYGKHRDSFTDFAKKQVPSLMNRWVDWDKFQNTYKQMTDILLEECGDNVLKEFEAIKKTKKLEEQDIEKEFIKMIEEVYGSWNNYEDYGKSLQKCSKRLSDAVRETNFGFVEKIFVTGHFDRVVFLLGDAGRSVLSACEDLKNKEE